jgi:hypothetical protein
MSHDPDASSKVPGDLPFSLRGTLAHASVLPVMTRFRRFIDDFV